MEFNFINIAKNGIYYYPANKHYGGIGYVTCDRCARTNISACIGYDSLDLCLDCVSVVIKSTNNSLQKNTQPKQEYLSRMMQRMYKSEEDLNDDRLTYMCQDMYK